MKTDNASSGPSSATTSSSAPSSTSGGTRPPERKDPDKHDKDNPAPPSPTAAPGSLSESEFLTQQANAAREALQRALSEAVGKLGEGANPVQWAKEYPWVAMGAAAVAGFVGASLVVPSKEEQALKRLAAIERALNPHPPKPRNEPDHDEDREAKSYKAKDRSFMSILLREVLSAVRPALVSLLTAGVTAKAAKPSEEEMEAAAANQGVKERAGTGDAP